MHVVKNIAKDIADHLNLGFKCFLNIKTMEVITLLTDDNLSDLDDAEWADNLSADREKVDGDANFIEIEPMDSTTSYQITDFIGNWFWC